MNAQTPLPLKDIHLPPAIGAWPPAPGWWLAGLLVIAVTATIVIVVIRHRRRTAYRRAALVMAKRHASEFAQHRDNSLLAIQCSELLRRVAIAAYGNTAAGISGDAWLHFLDNKVLDNKVPAASAVMNKFRRNNMSKNIAPKFAALKTALLEAPYRPTVNYDAQALQQAVQYWIKKHRAR